jgi:hypothetical protein
MTAPLGKAAVSGCICLVGSLLGADISAVNARPGGRWVPHPPHQWRAARPVLPFAHSHPNIRLPPGSLGILRCGRRRHSRNAGRPGGRGCHRSRSPGAVAPAESGLPPTPGPAPAWDPPASGPPCAGGPCSPARGTALRQVRYWLTELLTWHARPPGGSQWPAGQPDGYQAEIAGIPRGAGGCYPEASIWFGHSTMRWWAMASGPEAGWLVSADSPVDLAQLLDVCLRCCGA